MTYGVRIVTASLALATLVGCGSEQPAQLEASAGSSARAATTTTSSAVAAPTASASTSPRAKVSIKEASAHYLKVVEPLNASGQALDDAKGWTRIGSIRPTLETYIEELDRFAREMLTYPWPESVEPTAKRMATAVLQNRSDLKSALSMSTDMGAVTAFNAALDSDTSPAIATEMRIALGLPSN